jgi:cytochrome P450
MDSASEFILGEGTNCLGEEVPKETQEFMKAFDRSILGLAMLFIFGPIRWPLYWDPYFVKAYRTVFAHIDKHSSRALAKPVNQNKDEDKKYVIIEEVAKAVRDPADLRFQAINIMFPARDTSAVGFSNAIFELARHPDEWDKLVAEVRAIDPNQKLTYEFIRSLKRLKAIVSETLRLHLSNSRIGRVSLKDAVLPKGGGEDGQSPIFIPKGTNLEMDLFTVQRNPTYWGPDANEWKPDRWKEGRPLWEAKWQYEPFLGGLRMCPAYNQVLTQISYLLIRFAQMYRTLENRDPVKEYVEKIYILVESRNGATIAVGV